MGGRCSCDAADDDVPPTLSKLELKENLRSVIERNEAAVQTRERGDALTERNEIEVAIETYGAHQEELDLCIEILKQVPPSTFTEIRVMKSPPQSIVHIIAVAALILGESDVDWKSLQKFLLKSKDPFLAYDFDEAPREDIDKAKQYADNIGDLFEASRAQFASETCYYIFIWCRDVFQLHQHREFLETREIAYSRERIYSTKSFAPGTIEKSLMNGDPIMVKQDVGTEMQDLPSLGGAGVDTLKMSLAPSSFAEINHGWMSLAISDSFNQLLKEPQVDDVINEPQTDDVETVSLNLSNDNDVGETPVLTSNPPRTKDCVE